MDAKTLSGVLLGVLLLVLPSYAQSLDNHRVSDFADLLSVSEEQALTDYCNRIEANTTVQVAVVSVKDTGGEDRTLFANKVGKENGVGKAATDNGVVVLYSLSNEAGGAIGVGSGIESTLNDAKVGRIGRGCKPLFDNKSYYSGYSCLLDGLNAEIEVDNSSAGSPTTATDVNWVFLVVLVVVILVVALVLALASAGRSGSYGGYVGSSSSDDDDDDSGGGWGGSGGGGSSSGGFSGGFGGGGFSGGGAKF